MHRAVGRSENPGVLASSNKVGKICPPVEIGLTDLPKFGGAMASLAPSVPTGLKFTSFSKTVLQG